MTIELLLFGVVLIGASTYNYFKLNSTDTPTHSTKVTAHVEYLLGMALFFFAVPVNYSIAYIGAFTLVAVGVNLGMNRAVRHPSFVQIFEQVA